MKEIVGNKVKIYRTFRCNHCEKFYEIEITNVDKEDVIVCPWCETNCGSLSIEELLYRKTGDKIVRCD